VKYDHGFILSEADLTVTTQTHRRAVLVVYAVMLTASTPGFAQLRTFVPQIPDDSSLRGGVPTGLPTAESLALSLGDVIDRALANNLGVITSASAMDRANGTRRVAMSDLLPSVRARVGETRQKTNLEAFGLPTERFGLSRAVGPFNVFDARVFLSQTLFDLEALNDVRAEGHNVTAARLTLEGRRDAVSLLAAGLYVQTLAANARAQSARAQRQTAQALLTQAQDLKQSGVVAGIEVLRAQVRLSLESQHVTVAENDARKTQLQLARMIGLPLGQEFTLKGMLPDVSMPETTLEQALLRAYAARPDYLGAVERVRAAEASRQAARGAALPAVHATADYGRIGLSPSNAIPTFAVGGSITVPLFQGGRVQGRVIEADADLRTRRAEAENLRADIYYDIRNAFLDLQATDEERRTATQSRDLADQQLAQARDRFQAGVASNIEIVQAQEAVALAQEQFIDATFGSLMAKAVLAGSLGVAEEEIKRYLGGVN
jgi:outer membrane protein TolC